ncbi:hypothetical protein ACFLTE_07025 [Bacteroidota bacterium]
MNKINKLFIIGLLIFINSCEVYEEDTFISIRKPKQRLTGIWKLDKIENKGEDFTDEYFGINKDLTIEYIYNETYERYSNDTLSSYGIWSLAGESENELIHIPVDDWENEIYTIKRLQRNNLWVTGYDDYFLDSLLFMYTRIE